MPDHDQQSNKSSQLRQRAEAMLQQRSQVESPVNAEMLELIHELEVHQMELEIQNEELQRAQEEISALHHEYEDLYEFAPCGYLTLNSKGLITRCNLSGVTILGAEKTQLKGSGFSSFVAPEMRDDFWAALRRAGKSKEKQSVQLKLISAGREPLWVLADIKADQIASGEVGQWRLVLVDNNGRKLAEEALRQSEARAQAMLQAIPDLMFRMDSQGVFIDYKADISDLYIQSEPSLIGKRNRDLTPPEFANLVEQQIRTTIETGTMQTFEYQLPVPDRGERAYEARMVVSGAGEVTAIVRDVTERKQAEEALRKSEDRHQTLIQTAMDGIWWVDLHGHLMEVNDAYCRMSGYSKSELLAMHIADLEAIEGTEEIAARIDQIVAAGQAHFETKHRRRNGSIFDIEANVQYLPVSTGRIAAIIRDVTERKKADKALRVSLAEKELLLREIHHRIKNNMSLICSLIHLHSADITDKELLQTFQSIENRVRSMALVHEKLYQSKDLVNIDLGTYIHDLANSLVTTYRVGSDKIWLAFDVDSIVVDVETAMPCGLIINELISNALKHAFPEKEKGLIRVCLQKTTDGFINLSLADDGVGLPPDFDIRTTKSLGMNIVTSIAEHQLQGTLEMHSDLGTEIRIRFQEPHYPVAA